MKEPEIQEILTLKMGAEELAAWHKNKTTKKIMAFLAEKQAEVVKAWLAGDYPQKSLEEAGLWTQTMAAEHRGINLVQTLHNYLPQNQDQEQ